MSTDAPQKELQDNLYLKIWEIEQAHSSKRWTITTFFLGISFAVLGFSFTTEKVGLLVLPQYLAAVISYWFAYMIFVRLNDYTRFLRDYLSGFESSGAVSFRLQANSRTYMSKRQQFSTTKLLLYFGIIYTVGIGIVAFWLLQVR